MKTKVTNHSTKSSVKNSIMNTKKTLINSLSPNFSYVNKSGGIVIPEQCCMY